jgi:hypothetical protein
MVFRITSFVGGVLMLALAFLRWKTGIAGIPIIVYSVVGILLLMLAIGPTSLVEWRRAEMLTN